MKPPLRAYRSLLLADTFVRWGFTLVVCVAWVWAGAVLPIYLFPGPLPVIAEASRIIIEPSLSRHLLASLLHIFASVSLAFVFGMALALTAYYATVTRLLIEGRIAPFLNAFASIGWTLLAVIWFGINTVTVIFAITINLVPFYLINIMQGLKSIDLDYLEMGQSFTGRKARIFRRITLPMLSPFLFASFNLAFGVAWKIALTAELLGGDRGLGYLLNLAMQQQDTVRILAITLLAVFFVYFIESWVIGPIQTALDRRFRVTT